MSPHLLLAVSVEHAIKGWVYRLGGVGLIGVALLDNSVVPLPGSLDASTILLASAHPGSWWYYGMMATIGAVIGGSLTYRLANAGEKEFLEKKIGKQRAEKVYRKFDKTGFWTLFVGSLLPPPFPMVPELLAAGALHYPRKNFLTALGLGRGIRFFLDAYLGHVYGAEILGFFRAYYQPVLYALIGLAIAGGLGALFYFAYWRKKHPPKPKLGGSSKDNPQVA